MYITYNKCRFYNALLGDSWSNLSYRDRNVRLFKGFGQFTGPHFASPFRCRRLLYQFIYIIYILYIW